jgi:hypothetical protein
VLAYGVRLRASEDHPQTVFGDFIKKPISLQAESAMGQEQYDIVLLKHWPPTRWLGLPSAQRGLRSLLGACAVGWRSGLCRLRLVA